MNRLFEALRPFIRTVVWRPVMVLLVGFALSLAGAYFAFQLRIDTDFANLVPEHYPSVQALERLREEVGGESEIDVIIESPSFEANRAFAEAFMPRALDLRGQERAEPYVSRVEWRRDTEFLEQNALYFATDDELDRLEDYLEGQAEQARLEASPFYFDIEEDFDDEEEADEDIVRLRDNLHDIVPTEYPISEDSTIMVLRFYPTGAQTDLAFIRDAYSDLAALAADLNPNAFHPEMTVDIGGRMLRQYVEVRSITRDVLSSFGGGVTTVMLIVMAYFFYKAYRARAGKRFAKRYVFSEMFRMPLAALIIGIPLSMSLAWTFGIAYLTFGFLNLMTSTLILVLFGLGIDYGIHFFGRYAEERVSGRSVEGAAEETFMASGPAIAVSALTTSAAMFVLMIADFKGFSEFGFIAGIGILLALVAMLVLLPALLAVLERFRAIRLEPRVATSEVALGGPTWKFPAARRVLVGSLIAVGLVLFLLPRVKFEYDFGKLEPTFYEYQELRERSAQVYPGARRNPAYILVDTPEEVQPVVNAIRAHAAQDTLTPTIDSVESLQDRYPFDPEGQQRRVERVTHIRTLLDDPYLAAADSEDLDRLRRAAQTTAPIPMDDIPEFLTERFRDKDGQIGNFIIIYPSVGLSDGRKSIQFSEDVGTVVTDEGRVYHAGSTSLVAADMLRLMRAESPIMVGITALLLLLFMGFMFRSFRWTFLAVSPLVVGVLWMLGLMVLFDVRLNFYNLVVLPAVLGIGNDCGIHIVHRYREEGSGSLRRVLRSTGEHITIGSLTTMVSFAWWLLSYHPGLRTIGELAVLGIGATLIAALTFLPAIIQWMEDRDLHPSRHMHVRTSV